MRKDHGHVNWTELWTPDVEAAKAFYASMFGWKFDAMPGSEGSYWLAKRAKKPLCGLFQWQDADSNRWFTHFTVDDVDAAVKASLAAGGAVVKPAFDIPGVGRVAILKDVTGAAVGVMTPE